MLTKLSDSKSDFNEGEIVFLCNKISFLQEKIISLKESIVYNEEYYPDRNNELNFIGILIIFCFSYFANAMTGSF